MEKKKDLEQIAPSPFSTNAQDRNRTCTPVKALGPEPVIGMLAKSWSCVGLHGN
jgi:hypothetical protein